MLFDLDGSLTDKGEVIAEVLKQLPNTPKNKIAMVGDRMHDMVGAVKNGIVPIGVLCGFGDRAELQGSGAKFIITDLKALEKIL